MAILQSVSLSGAAGRRIVATWVGLLAALMSGCVTTSTSFWKGEPEPPCQLVCTWQNTVVFAPNPANGGQPAPGVLGRVYLFGKELDYPLCCRGSLTVDLYDETAGEPVLLERWIFDPDNVDRLSKKDQIGLGYTLFLPWSRYRADINKIRLRTAFTREKGAVAPIYTENKVTLDDGNGVIREGKKPLAVNTVKPIR